MHRMILIINSKSSHRSHSHDLFRIKIGILHVLISYPVHLVPICAHSGVHLGVIEEFRVLSLQKSLFHYRHKLISQLISQQPRGSCFILISTGPFPSIIFAGFSANFRFRNLQCRQCFTGLLIFGFEQFRCLSICNPKGTVPSSHC